MLETELFSIWCPSSRDEPEGVWGTAIAQERVGRTVAKLAGFVKRTWQRAKGERDVGG